jgi:beta-barrel assembly-enhancing protease
MLHRLVMRSPDFSMWIPFRPKRKVIEPILKTAWNGYYYDGQSANRHPTTVTLLPSGLELCVNLNQRIWWPYNELQETQGFYREDPIRLERRAALPEALVVEDPAFLIALRKIAPTHADRFRSPPDRLRAIRLIIAAVIASISLILGLVVWGIPLASDMIAPLIPPSWEVGLGDSLASHLAEPSLRCTNAELQKHLVKIVHRLSAASKSQPYQIHIFVMDTQIFNAFAAPGGLVVIHRPLLEATETSEQLAAVLAHEMQHVFHRHALKALIRDLSISLLVSAAFGDISGVGAFAAQGARTLTTLHYGRGAEEEADQDGLSLMEAAKLDPSEMIRFFEILRSKTGTAQLPGYLSSHPHPDERIGQLKMLIKDVNVIPLLPALEWRKINSLCH